MPKKVPPPTIPRLKAREPQQPRASHIFRWNGHNMGDGWGWDIIHAILDHPNYRMFFRPSVGWRNSWKDLEWFEWNEFARPEFVTFNWWHLQDAWRRVPTRGPVQCALPFTAPNRGSGWFQDVQKLQLHDSTWRPFSKCPACTANMPKCMAWTSWLHVSRNWALLWHFFMRSTSKSWDTVGIDWIVGGWPFLQQFWVKVYQIHIRPKGLFPLWCKSKTRLESWEHGSQW